MLCPSEPSVTDAASFLFTPMACDAIEMFVTLPDETAHVEKWPGGVDVLVVNVIVLLEPASCSATAFGNPDVPLTAMFQPIENV